MESTAIPTLIEIELAVIDANPWQPRARMPEEELEDLARSIAELGLLQPPLGRIVNGSRLQLAFGHRRVEAVRRLAQRGQWPGGVPVQVAQLSDRDMAVLALAENTRRKDLTPLEEYRAWQKALADAVGLDRSTVANHLRILKLPPVVLERVETGEMGAHAAREFLCLMNEDHCHEEDMVTVVKWIASMGGASGMPDWRARHVRKYIRDRVVGNEADWRPLGPSEGDVERYGYQGGAAREPTFDVEQFRQDLPHRCHHVPALEAASRLWTCDVKEWRRRQSAAIRAQNQAGEGGKPQGSRQDQALQEVLKKDPVARKLLGERVSTETAAVAVAQRMKPVQVHPEDHSKGAGYKRLNEHLRRFVQFHHDEASLKNLETSGESIHEALKLGEWGLILADVKDAVRKFVWDFRDAIKKESRKKAPATDPSPEDLGKLGTRAQVFTPRNEPPGLQHIDGGYRTPPFYFHDIQECRERCTSGAAWYQAYQGARLELVCTNQECYQAKLQRGKQEYTAQLAERHAQLDQRDRETAEVLAKSGMNRWIAEALARLATDATSPPIPLRLLDSKLAHWNWHEQEEFARLPAAMKRALDYLGLDSDNPGRITREMLLDNFNAADETTRVQVAAELAAAALGLEEGASDG